MLRFGGTCTDWVRDRRLEAPKVSDARPHVLARAH
jgi:hypothetical protein